jgi:hypothetical protein
VVPLCCVLRSDDEDLAPGIDSTGVSGITLIEPLTLSDVYMLNTLAIAVVQGCGDAILE